MMASTGKRFGVFFAFKTWIVCAALLAMLMLAIPRMNTTRHPFSVSYSEELQHVAENTNMGLGKLFARLLPSLPVMLDGKIIARVHEDAVHANAPWVNNFWGKVSTLRGSLFRMSGDSSL
jgi:hypothetical protein